MNSNAAGLLFYNPVNISLLGTWVNQTCTWTLFKATLDVTSVAGYKNTDSAAKPATTKATVVKKPNTPCARLTMECILIRNPYKKIFARESKIDRDQCQQSRQIDVSTERRKQSGSNKPRWLKPQWLHVIGPRVELLSITSFSTFR